MAIVFFFFLLVIFWGLVKISVNPFYVRKYMTISFARRSTNFLMLCSKLFFVKQMLTENCIFHFCYFIDHPYNFILCYLSSIDELKLVLYWQEINFYFLRINLMIRRYSFWGGFPQFILLRLELFKLQIFFRISFSLFSLSVIFKWDS